MAGLAWPSRSPEDAARIEVRGEPTGIAIGMAGSVVITQSAPRRPARSTYLAQVNHLAPPRLLDRGGELAELTAFCLEPAQGPYTWWQAGPWAGKSALLSTFVLHPPEQLAGRVRIVSFFVTARLAAQDTREAFTTVLLAQLSAFGGGELPAAIDEATREATLLDLLGQAAAACQANGGRLVLVVDGLDEDRSITVGPDARSIAGLLPASPPAGMRIIVAGRANPPIPDDVPDWHPLRDAGIVRPLSASPHAGNLQRQGRMELKRLLKGNSVEQDLLGLLAAARGGLSGPDLRELTGADLVDIEDVLHTVSGRTLNRQDSHWTPKTGPEVYLLGHEELHHAAIQYLGDARVEHYRQRLHAWADQYKAAEWPATTPEYLLRGYPRLLEDTHDLPRLLALATDLGRHDRLVEITGNDSAALREIAVAQDVALAAGPDLAALARLAVHRDALRQRNLHVPVQLVEVWARLGFMARAEAFVESIVDAEWRGQALQSIAQVAVQAGDIDHGEAIASSIPDPERRATTLLHVALAAPADRAAALIAQAAAVTDHSSNAQAQARMLVRIARTHRRLGDEAQAQVFADRAEQVGRSLPNVALRRQELLGIANVMARAGDFDRAERLGRDDQEPYDQVLAWCGFATAAFDLGEHSRALRLVEEASELASSVSVPHQRAMALAATAVAAARVGALPQCTDLAERAATAARALDDPAQQVIVLAWAAETVDLAGRKERAGALLDEAEVLAAVNDDSDPQSTALQTVAHAAARIGDFQRAETIIHGIGAQDTADRAVSDLGHAAVSAGQFDRAEALAGETREPFQKVQLLALLAGALIDAGRPDTAVRVASDAERSARSIIAADDQVESFAALTAAMSDAEQPHHVRYFATHTVTYARLTNNPLTRQRALTVAVQAMFRAGFREEALSVIDAEVDSPDRTQLAVLVASLMTEAGDPTGAQKLLAGPLADPQQAPQIHAVLATALAQAGNTTQARIAIDQAKKAVTSAGRADPPVAPLEMVDALIAVGEVDEAVDVAMSMDAPLAPSQALARVATAALAANRPETAAKALRAAVEVIESASEVHVAAQCLAAVAPALVRANQGSVVRTLLDQIQASLPSLEDYERAQLPAIIAPAAALAGDLDRAEALARTDLSPSWSSHAAAIADAAEAIVEAGDPDRAVRLVNSLESNWNSHVQARVVKTLAATGLTGEAETLARSIIRPDLQAIALAAIAAHASQPDDRRLLGQALRGGDWTGSIRVLARRYPHVAVKIADEVMRLVQDDPPISASILGGTYHPRLALDLSISPFEL